MDKPYGESQIVRERGIPDELRGLFSEYGEANVENTLIFIAQTRDPQGRRVHMPPTKEMVALILHAVHDGVQMASVGMEPEAIDIMAMELVEIRKLLKRMLDRGS